MAFRLIGSVLTGLKPVAPPKDNAPFKMANNEAAVAGSFCSFSTNTERLTKTVNDKLPAVLILESVLADAGGAEVRGMWVMPGMIFEAPYTDTDGTAPDTPHANAKVGYPGVEINALGTGVDVQESPVNGKFVIISLNTTAKTARVVLVNSLLGTYIANA